MTNLNEEEKTFWKKVPLIDGILKKILKYNREKVHKIFVEQTNYNSNNSILDIGTAASLDDNHNIILQKTRDNKNVFCLSEHDLFFLKKKYPHVKKFIKGDGKKTDFEKDSFDIVFTSATIEHVGSYNNQINFLRECLRLSKNYVFITTPNKYYPLDFHTKIPLIHWLPKKIHIVGGPNIPFTKQSYSEKITSFCKRSFFVSGHLKYRKYKSPERYCDDYLESCNLIMRRDLFLKCNGMNQKVYIGEDKELFKDLRKKIKNFKALFSQSIFVYHKQRKILKFLLQRLSYGTALFFSVNFKEGIKGFIPAVPIGSFFLIVIFFNLNLIFINKVYILLCLLFFINLFIYFELSKYVKNFKDKLLSIIIINLANVMHILGGVITLLGLRKILERKIFLMSR